MIKYVLCPLQLRIHYHVTVGSSYFLAIFDFFVQKWSKLVKHILDHKAAEKLNSKNSKDFLESKRYLWS